MQKDPSFYLKPILHNIDENIGRLSPKFVGEFIQILFHAIETSMLEYDGQF